ncbi:MAG: VCBS repeat-containing protein [Candidatus Delongbacteria bacterium]|nr:VCBS repeat-containing protein [Candidatus Delongbacteria bacterium]
MKKLLFIILLTLIGLLTSQSFTDIEAELVGVEYASVSWGDYDNDGDLDILLTGNTDSITISKIYRNDSGVFTDIEAALENVYLSSVEWGDFDNDGDLDILLTGHNGSNRISKVYRNDSGVFSDIYAGLSGVYRSSVSWGDYDNDGDLDILLTGSNFSESEISKIYRNDSGEFIDINANLIGVNWGSTAWGDYDNDGDLDILLAGRYYDEGYHYITSVYCNYSGVFLEVSTTLPKVCFSSVSWGDYDNDGDLDILMTGDTGIVRISKVFNNNAGIFTDTNAGLANISSGSATWGDYDNDGDLDILLAGSSSTGVVSIVYNNNDGVFTDINTGLTGTDRSSVYWGDEDNDGDLDILLSGRSVAGFLSKIYRNNSLVSNTSPNSPPNLSTTTTDSTITFSWDKATDNETPQNGLSYNLYIGTEPLTGDVFDPMSDIETGYRKIVHIGNAGQNTSWTIKDLPVGHYYWSVQAIDHAFAGSEFAEEKMFYNGFTDIEAGLQDVYFSSVDWGDYDNDDDLDILLTGYYYDDQEVKVSKIYRNDSGIYIEINSDLIDVKGGSASWGDYDNDGDLDILLTGEATIRSYEAKVYRNDFGEFNDISADLITASKSTATWGDYDNDGDLDILLTSRNMSKVYCNNSGIFIDINCGLIGLIEGTSTWGDYDSDGDLDILLCGRDEYVNGITKLYRNDSGVFVDVNIDLIGVEEGSLTWGDYDNDGDPDIVITGYCRSDNAPVSVIYQNNSGTLTDINAGLFGLDYSCSSVGDYDNDGDLDILITGTNDYSTPITILYQNNSGIFTEINTGLLGADGGSVAWGDYDNDGNLDILLTGDSILGGISKIYTNNSLITNTIPNSPSNLSTTNTDSTVTFRWDKATDNETPQDGLSYNLYIRTDSLECNINSSMSNTENGYRKVVNLGNVGQNTSWAINNLPNGRYYWSVQAIDHAFAGSDFAEEQSFLFGDLATPNNVAVTFNTGTVDITWDEVENATSYKVFTAVEPFGNYTDISSIGTFNGCSWSRTSRYNKQFYYVKAVCE